MQHKGESLSGSDPPILMAVDVTFWAGFFWETSETYLEGLPNGYLVDEKRQRSPLKGSASLPTKVLHYFEKRNYQFRAHLFQGRFVPGADATGLCDAYIKIYICHNTLKTQVQYQTLNPVWDQMLLLRSIVIYGLPQDIESNPPTVVIEAMDKDNFGKEEFMGRGLAKPIVKLVIERLNNNEEKSKLEWIELYNAGEYAGEVLSAFELVELIDEKEDLSFPKDQTRKGEFHRIPPYIRPTLGHYSLKVLFWGLRTYGRTNLNFDSNTLVTIDVGGITVKSSLKDKDDGNFSSSFASTEMELPKDLNYFPPITIKVWEKRSFGRLLLIGSHIVYSITQILKKEDIGFVWPVPISKEILPRQEFDKSKDESSDEDTDETKKPLLKSKKQAIRNVHFDRFLWHNRANKNEKYFSNDAQYYDWWTKYYESLRLHRLKSKDTCGGKKPCFAQCDDFSLEAGEPMAPTSEEDSKVGAQENSPDEQNKPIQKKILKPLFRKFLHILKFVKFNDGEFLRTPANEDDDKSSPPNKNATSTASFVIYPSELEKQREFNGFEDWVDSFIIFHGKKRRTESQGKRIVGKFKGTIALEKIEVGRTETKDGTRGGVSESIADRHTVHKTAPPGSIVTASPLQIPSFKILVRVYVVRAFSLPPKDRSGRSDPYVVVSVGRRISKGTESKRNSKFGRRVSGDRTQYVEQDLNPIFGRCYEVEATLPRDNTITVSVWDWDLGSHDDLIGTTEIDIENRFFTKCRATCGISSSYETYGYNTWRDPEKPSSILKALCQYYQMATPEYKNNEIKIGESCFYCDNPNTLAMMTHQKETLALAVLKQWTKVSTQEGKNGLTLVPEHIETRSLFHPKKESIVQGKLEMWVDMFQLPKWIEDKESEERFLGPPIDISPRKPQIYELRVIIWNTANMELHDINIFNEKSSDLYVKGWLYGPDIDGQNTDVHHRSLTGEGNFNWRFIFPLSYLQPEKCMVTPQQDNSSSKITKFVHSLITGIDGQESGKKIPCRLNFQVWDEDRFTADDFIGALSLDLNNCPIGAKTAKACNLSLLEDQHKKVDVFKIGRVKGWWPVVKSEITEDRNKKKDSNFILTGKIEAEIQMLMENEAKKRPVGKGREGPDALPEPKRPDTSYSWLTNPFYSLKFGIWKNNRKKIITGLIIVLLFIFFLLMIYAFPGYLIKKILGV